MPVEHRPYYVWSEMFGKPTTISKGANAYQQAMLRKAANWSLQEGAEAFKRHEAGEPDALKGWIIDPKRLGIPGSESN